jgi:hypothetical protein
VTGDGSGKARARAAPWREAEARSLLPDGARHGRLGEQCKEIRKGDQKRSHRKKGIRQADPQGKKEE